MGSFSIHWRSSTKKDMRSLPKQEARRVLDAVNDLAEQPYPHGCQKLTNSERTFRIRIGDYRVIYEVNAADKLVEIQRVRHRREVYR